MGFREWFPADAHHFNYGPDGELGTQVSFYRAIEASDPSRHGTGLQHLAFSVPTRGVVEPSHRWAVGRGSELVHEPRAVPEYGEHTFATYFLDPHGIMLEVGCHVADVASGGAEETSVAAED